MDHKIVGTMGNLLRKKGLHDSASSCERQIKNGNWVVIQLNTKVRLHLALRHPIMELEWNPPFFPRLYAMRENIYLGEEGNGKR